MGLTIAADGSIVDSLQVFRAKRGGGIYEATGIASDSEIAELHALATDLWQRIEKWMHKWHPELITQSPKARQNAPKRRAGDGHR